MIHIDFDEPQTETWRKWRQRCQRAHDRHISGVEKGEKPQVSDVYRDMKPDVYAHPEGPFHGKCAYCSQGITNPHNQPGDIEHFRPKSRVLNGDGSPVLVPDDGGTREHPGYYWLAYDWRNLLLVCDGCNTRQRDPNSGEMVGKGMVFPVKDFRAARPGEEVQEEPLLLHPVCDNPADHLDMDPMGVLHWGESERGEATATVLGLNLRGLPEARRKVYDDTRMKMGIVMQAVANESVSSRISYLIEELKRAKEGPEEHSIASRRAIEETKQDSQEFFGQM